MDTKVSITKCPEYNREMIYVKVKESFALLGGMEEFHGKKILLKVNLLFAVTPDKNVTTHPDFVWGVIKALKELGADIIVGDSPGMHSTEQALKKSGIMDVIEELGVKWTDFSQPVEVANPDGKLIKRFTVSTVYNEVDYIFSLPKMKTHSLMYYTGAIKNMFGMIPGVLKAQWHMRFTDREHFAAMLVDLSLLLKPSFTIMDAIVAMEGPGPGSGYPKQVGLILASRNVLALDIVASQIMGYNPLHIPTNRDALERKVWLESEKQIQTVGESLSDVLVKDYLLIKEVNQTGFLRRSLPSGLARFFESIVVPSPAFLRNKCIVCGECKKICPAKALEIKKDRKDKRYIAIDYKKCIRCYCCHEICPEDAIRLKRFKV